MKASPYRIKNVSCKSQGNTLHSLNDECYNYCCKLINLWGPKLTTLMTLVTLIRKTLHDDLDNSDIGVWLALHFIAAFHFCYMMSYDNHHIIIKPQLCAV